MGWVNLSGDIIVLNEGESVEGILIDKYESSRYPGRMIYKIKFRDSDKVGVLVGSTVLDNRLRSVLVGSLIRIKRLDDSRNSRGQRVKVFDVAIWED